MKEVLPEKPFNEVWAEQKKERHLDNLRHLTGWFHGTYFQEGMTRQPIKNKFPKNGKIYEMPKM